MTIDTKDILNRKKKKITRKKYTKQESITKIP